MKTLSVVNVMLGRGLGGIEQALLDYSEATALAGFASHAVIDAKALVKPALQEKHIAFSTLSNRGAWDITAIWRLRRLLRRLQADICIAHGNRALSLLHYAAAGRPLVTVTHNYSNKSSKADYIFCPTRALMRHVEMQGFPANRMFHLPNMVRAAAVMPARARHTPLVIGSLGRFVKKKGFDVLIDALALLKQKNIPFQARLGGSGEEELTLKAQLHAKGLEENIVFCGWVEDKQAFFSALDIFCLPSQHEPFGIVLLEAMAAGLPIVSTDSEGPAEIIQHQSDGLLVPKNNAVLLAAALDQLIKDTALQERLAAGAWERAKSRYDIAVISNELKILLERISVKS